MSAVWFAVALVGACVAFIGMYRSGAHASGGTAQLSPLIAFFGGGVMWVATALHFALRRLLPAEPPKPEQTTPVDLSDRLVPDRPGVAKGPGLAYLLPAIAVGGGVLLVASPLLLLV